MTPDEAAVRTRLEAQRDDLAGRVDRLQAAEREETAHSGDVGGETDNAHEWENAEIREGEIGVLVGIRTLTCRPIGCWGAVGSRDM